MGEKAQKSEQFIINKQEQIIYELSLEELAILLDEHQTTFIEDLFFEINERDYDDLVIE